MFRHKGKSRTLTHNLRIASLLSLVAGVVNIAGFLAIARLTTNVTGHFAYLIDEVFKADWWQALDFLLYILSFFLGAFSSTLLTEVTLRRNGRLGYVVPIFAEASLLVILALSGPGIARENPDALACLMLFAMGLQNALVTSISNAVVRTTHLTGLFTDLGIEMAQLFFYREAAQKSKLWASIRLRLTIITSFFLGGLLGAVGYRHMGLEILAMAAATLFMAMGYDYLKLRLILLRRRAR